MHIDPPEIKTELKHEPDTCIVRLSQKESAEITIAQAASEEEIEPVLRKMHANETDRLLQMDIDALLEVVRKERQNRLQECTPQLIYVLGVSLVAFLIAKCAHNRYLLDHLLGIIPGVLLGGRVVSRKRKAAAMALSRFDDVRAVGPLAEALEFKDSVVRSIATQSLIRLLPRLQASDAPLFNSAQRSCLNRVLQGKEVGLILAILKAWEQVGDSGAITDVQNLAEGRGEGGRFPKVVRAAQDCLPALRQSAERQQIGAHLLRPTDGNLTPPSMLLRPTISQSAVEPPGQLLRSTDDA